MNRLTPTVLAIVILFAYSSSQGAVGPQRPVIETKPLDSRVLADFGTADGAAIAAAQDPQVKVGFAGADKGLRINFPRQEQFPSALLWKTNGKDGDWSGFDYLRLDVTNTGKARTTFWLYFYDGAATGETQRGEFAVGVDPGRRCQMAVPLRVFYRADRSLVDIKKMNRVRMAFERQVIAGEVLIDKLKLVKIFDGPRTFFFFDFQNVGQPLAHGTLPVTPQTLYNKQTGYGFTQLAGLSFSNLAGGKFPVFCDGISGAKVPFAVDLPNGKYEVQAIVKALAAPGVPAFNYSIDAQGKRVVDVPLTEEIFYSGRGLYWGADLFHDPTKSLWQQYGRDYFKPEVFAAEVTDGQLKLDFNNCGVYAAWIYPADQAAAGRAMIEAIQGEQDWRVNASVARLADAPDAGAPSEPDAQSKARGFIVFARPVGMRVYPNRNPRPDEMVAKVTLATTPGQYEPATFTLRPLKDLKNVTVEVSDLAGPGGATLPKAAIKLDIVKYFPLKTGALDCVLTPSYLFPIRPLDLYKDFNRQYWLTVHPGDDAAPGTYAGQITIKPEGSTPVQLPLEVTIYPFKLADSPKGHGFFNLFAPDYQWVSMFPRRKDALAREVIDAEMDDMIAHGVTGTWLPFAQILSVSPDGSDVKLDWSKAKLYAEMLRKHGLDKYEHLGSCDMQTLARYCPELTPAFNKAYPQLVSQTGAFWKEQGIKVIFQIVDEPREEEPSRNRVSTIKYAKMARPAANGMKLYLTPMGDADQNGNHYTVLMPLVDVWMTHCWPGSMRGMYMAGKEKLAELWFYNNGLDRFQWGYHLWKMSALGDYEWVYVWGQGAHPLIDDTIGSAMNDYVVPWNKSVLPTLNYEWGRQGVDDLRYLATLEQAIAQAPKDGPAAAAAQEAKTFLALLRRVLPEYPESELSTGAEAGAAYRESGVRYHFDAWRQQIAQYILAIRSGAAPVRIEAAWTPLPKKAAEGSKTAICILTDKAPVIDGKLDKEFWKGVPVQTDFINLALGEVSALNTEVKIASDGKKIYFAFHCVEPKYGELKAYATRRDGDVWKDDAVELFLDTTHNKKDYFHIIVNTLGTIQDSDSGDASWDGDIQTAVQKGQGYWDVEIAISLDSLKAKVGPDVNWGINLCRDRTPDPRENASWANVSGGYHSPGQFGLLKFAKK